MPGDVSTADRHQKEIEQALGRAASQAEKLARETGTPLVLWEDGHIVERSPHCGPFAPAQEKVAQPDR